MTQAQIANETKPMDAASVAVVCGWLDSYAGDVEKTARWMAKSLRIGGLPECRDLVNQAAAFQKAAF